MQASVKLARELGFPVNDNIRSKLNAELEEDAGKWKDTVDLRKATGDAAKSCAWFKSITGGERWAETIFPAFGNTEFEQKDFAIKLSQFRAWVDNE